MLNAQQLAVLSGELGAQQYASLMAAQEYDAVAALLNVQAEIANPSPSTRRRSRPRTWLP